jgi:uncharacterized protein (TIGR02246 family)
MLAGATCARCGLFRRLTGGHDVLDFSAWIATYNQAWLTRNADAAAELFTGDAIYQSHPLRPPHRGRDAIRAYWQQATETQEELELRWGTPVIAGNRVAVEWWATMREMLDGERTVPGCLILRFADSGLCEELREYWHVETGRRVPPPSTWGQ